MDGELDELLVGVSALALDGAKGVGKTSTALQRARTVYRLDDPFEMDVLRAEPTRISTGTPPILVDEWQRLPSTWDVVRRAVDDHRMPGRFILTGSASPTTPPTHSGAARIVSVRMRPLALAERGLEQPTVSMAALLTGDNNAVAGSADMSLEDYAEEILASGFPGLRGVAGRARRAELDGYLSRIIDRDIPDQGYRVRDRGGLRRWLRAYAAATSTTTSMEKVRLAAAGVDGNELSRSTALPYRRLLEQLWILDPLDGWLPSRNRLSRLSSPPTHHLVDPALAARVLDASLDTLLKGGGGLPTVPRDGTLIGGLFESLATLCVRVYAQASEASVGHLRTKGGEHEIDLVVERGDGRIVAIEVKLAQSITDHDVRHLKWLQRQLGDDVLDALVLNTGRRAYRRADGIAVVPLSLLGA